MSYTPRTDAKRSGPEHFMGDWVDANFACQLERELNAANTKIKRLEEAGDELLRDNNDMVNINRWHKAKEDKP